MGVLDNPDLINDSSILLSTDLLDSHVGGVGTSDELTTYAYKAALLAVDFYSKSSAAL